jgi:hypothetical protein
VDGPFRFALLNDAFDLRTGHGIPVEDVSTSIRKPERDSHKNLVECREEQMLPLTGRWRLEQLSAYRWSLRRRAVQGFLKTCIFPRHPGGKERLASVAVMVEHLP